MHFLSLSRSVWWCQCGCGCREVQKSTCLVKLGSFPTDVLSLQGTCSLVAVVETEPPANPSHDHNRLRVEEF
jgi:hypothetical protein